METNGLIKTRYDEKDPSDFCRGMADSVKVKILEIRNEFVAAIRSLVTLDDKAKAIRAMSSQYQAITRHKILVNWKPVHPMEGVAEYIHEEMVANVADGQLAGLNVRLLGPPEQIVAALRQFAGLVGSGR